MIREQKRRRPPPEAIYEDDDDDHTIIFCSVGMRGQCQILLTAIWERSSLLPVHHCFFNSCLVQTRFITYSHLFLLCLSENNYIYIYIRSTRELIDGTSS